MKLIPPFNSLTSEFSALLSSSMKTASGKNIVQLYASSWDFDQSWYKHSNQDLLGATPSEVFPTLWHHFVFAGYFEGRLPVEPVVDEDWYMHQYSDVAAAVVDGTVSSARDHFFISGRLEGRLPCDPGIDHIWYGKVFLGADDAFRSDPQVCLAHFIKHGYLNGATPGPSSLTTSESNG